MCPSSTPPDHYLVFILCDIRRLSVPRFILFFQFRYHKEWPSSIRPNNGRPVTRLCNVCIQMRSFSSILTIFFNHLDTRRNSPYSGRRRRRRLAKYPVFQSTNSLLLDFGIQTLDLKHSVQSNTP